MIDFPSTTLFIADCLNVERAIKVVERCKRLCNFASIKLLTSLPTDYEHKVEIMPLNSLVAYSIFMLTKSHEYVDTPHCLVVQRDGWILNPQSWDNRWLQYDYAGALFNQYDLMGVGGFSFRSKALMKSVSEKYPAWDGSEEDAQRIQKIVGIYEDGAIAITLRKTLQREGFTFMPIGEAGKFCGGGNPNVAYYHPYPFGFHGAWRRFDQETGLLTSEIKVVDLPQPL